MSDHAASLVARHDPLAEHDGVLAMGEREPGTSSFAMQLMYSRLVARLYDRPWRPLSIRAVSTLDYAAEDSIVDRHLAARSDLRLLDLCCGTARAGRRWIARNAEVLGVDRSLVMLREARRRCESDRLVLVHGDACVPYARPAAFDGAFCFAALHLLDDPLPVIHAAAAALRPRGIFFAWVVSSAGILRRHSVRKLAAGIGVSVRETGWLAAVTANSGFELLEQLVFGSIEFVVGRRKPG